MAALRPAVMERFQKRGLGSITRRVHVFDAGGGTGRWSLKVLLEYPESTGYTYDLSEDMLRQAKAKREANDLQDRWTIRQGDLHAIEGVQPHPWMSALTFITYWDLWKSRLKCCMKS